MNAFQLNDGHKIPQTGFGVFMVEAGRIDGSEGWLSYD